jgi:prevent-host-death family protein
MVAGERRFPAAFSRTDSMNPPTVDWLTVRRYFNHPSLLESGRLSAERGIADDPQTSVYPIRYTPCMAKTVPVREFRTRLSELLSDVADRRDHVLVTRNGKPAAALVPIDEYEALEETAEILSDSATLTAIEAGLAELARGDSVTLDELRRDLAERRRAR